MQQVRKPEDVCAAHDTPLIAAALQFPLGHDAVKTVILGASSPDEVRQNVAIFDTPIPQALWSDLKTEGLIRADAPTPKETRHVAQHPPDPIT